jgi:hypothetical protein
MSQWISPVWLKHANKSAYKRSLWTCTLRYMLHSKQINILEKNCIIAIYFYQKEVYLTVAVNLEGYTAFNESYLSWNLDKKKFAYTGYFILATFYLSFQAHALWHEGLTLRTPWPTVSTWGQWRGDIDKRTEVQRKDTQFTYFHPLPSSQEVTAPNQL